MLSTTIKLIIIGICLALLSITCDEVIIDFPSSPQNLTATYAAKNATLKWDPADNADGYTLYYAKEKDNIKGWGKKIPNVSSPYSQKNLKTDRNHYYVVVAFNQNGESEASSPASIILIEEEDDFEDDEDFLDDFLDDEELDSLEGDDNDLNNSNSNKNSNENASEDDFDDFDDFLDDLEDDEENLTTVEIFEDDIQRATLIKWEEIDSTSTYRLYWSTEPDVDIYDDTTEYFDEITSPYTHTDLENGNTYYYLLVAVDEVEEETVISEEFKAQIWTLSN